MSRIVRRTVITLFALTTIVQTTTAQEPFGTTFVYQGRLFADGVPLDGEADFEVVLWDAATGGAQVGPSVSLSAVDLDADGLFTLRLDYGDGAFNGERRWISVAVRSPPGGGGFVTLAPRQELTPTPYAIYAQIAGLSLTTLDLTPPLDLTSNLPFTIRGTNTANGVGIIARNTGAGPALQAIDDGLGTGTPLVAVVSNPASASAALQATSVGTGHGIVADLQGNIGAADALHARTEAHGAAVRAIAAGAGSTAVKAVADGDATIALTAEITNAANPAAAARITHAGMGAGLEVETAGGVGIDVTRSADVNANLPGVRVLLPAAESESAVEATTLGSGSAVYGQAADAPPVAAKVAGVSGASGTQRGVAGRSWTHDGVLGESDVTGTLAGSNGPLGLRGAVHGHATDGTGIYSEDSFAVVGTGVNNATGELGVGSGTGEGVLGISGIPSVPPGTSAGVQGVTREDESGGNTWPPYFALRSAPDKGQVGVLGQSVQRVGVWGESKSRIGVVGNSGDERAFADLPGGARDPQPIGVYGAASQADSFGVLGRVRPPNDSGVGVVGESPKFGVAGYASHGDFDVAQLPSTAAGVFGKPGDDLPMGFGVHGQAKAHTGAGVLGESQKTGVIGAALQTVGFDPASAPGLPVGVYGTSDKVNAYGVYGKATASYATGVYGRAEQGDGVVGRSYSTSNQDSGVLAMGNGSSGAAALRLHDGGIRVTGTTRAAGTVAVTSFPNMLPGCVLGCEPYCPPQECCWGFYFDQGFANTLIHANPESIILLTAKVSDTDSQCAIVAHVTIVTEGFAQFRVSVTPGDLNGDGLCNFFDIQPLMQLQIKVNYLIMNAE